MARRAPPAGDRSVRPPEGLPGVTEVVVFPERLELQSAGMWVTVRLLDIARWHRRGWLYRPLARLGCGVWG